MEFIEHCHKNIDRELNQKELENIRTNLLDEVSVATSHQYLTYKGMEYSVYISPGFRMCSSFDNKHECVIITIDQDHTIVVNVGKRVIMHYFGENNICYSYSTRFFNTNILAYVVLFIMEMNFDENVDLLWFLMDKHRSKPFTSHLVFSPNSYQGDCRYSSYRSLKACYNLYKSFLHGEEDLPFSYELACFKPWRLYNYEQFVEYNQHMEVVKEQYEIIRQQISYISLLYLMSQIQRQSDQFINMPFMLFREALVTDRLDIATWLWYEYKLPVEPLYQMAQIYPFNTVTSFVYSLL